MNEWIDVIPLTVDSCGNFLILTDKKIVLQLIFFSQP